MTFATCVLVVYLLPITSVKERFLSLKKECQNHTDYSPFRRSLYLHFQLCIFELFCEMLWILPWYIEAYLLSELQLNVVLIQSLEHCLLVGQTTETKLVLWNDDCQVFWSCIRQVNTQQGLGTNVTIASTNQCLSCVGIT